MATLDEDDRAYLEALVSPLRAEMADHHDRLYGNGQPGVLTEVAGLKRDRVWAAAIGTFFAAIAGAVTGHYWHS